MRILIRSSKTAVWARRIGALAVPLLVLSIALHHFGLMPTYAFQVAGLLSGIVAALASLLALVALVRLWITGDHGWRNAFWGLFWGLLCLLPFAWHAHLAMRFPPVTDIATASVSFLPLTFEPDTALMPPPQTLSRRDQLTLFPGVLTRAYPIAAEDVHALILRLIEQRGWDVRFDRAPGQFPGRVNARITTLVGFREEAVWGIAATETGTQVDMRSASIGANHDFGSNGTRITSFLNALDAEVTAFLAANPDLGGAEGQEAAQDDTAAPNVITDGT